jgi:hypothetical protein
VLGRPDRGAGLVFGQARYRAGRAGRAGLTGLTGLTG